MEAPKFRNILAMSAISIGSLAFSEQTNAFSPQLDPVTAEEDKRSAQEEDLPFNPSDTQIYILAGVALGICAVEIVYLDRRDKRRSAASRNTRPPAEEQKKDQTLTDSPQ